MKNLFILLLAAAALCSCNRVTDPAPDSPQIPASVMQLVEKTYENPQNMVFTEILEDKIWNVELESKARKYSSTLTPKNILSASRLAGSEVPDTLKMYMDPSFIAGGTFSNFREEEYAYGRAHFESAFLADYEWRGNSYLLKWRITTFDGIAPTLYTLEMAPVSNKFPVTGANDLPEPLQQYIQNKGYRFSLAVVLMGSDGKKIYQLYLHKDGVDFQLLFNEDSKLMVGSDQHVFLENQNELPEDIRDYLASDNDYKDFTFSGAQQGIALHKMDGITSYVIRGQKAIGTTGGMQYWLISFDQNRKPVYREYFAVYK